MNPSSFVSHFCRSAALLGLLQLSSALGAPKTDLSRFTPVAADQPIPVADFFRKPTLHSVGMNESGTLIVGTANADQDKQMLLIHSIDTGKTNFFMAPLRKELGSWFWLGDRTLGFSLVKDKLFSFGLYGVDVEDLKSAFPLLQYCSAQVLGGRESERATPYAYIHYDSFYEKGRGLFKINSKIRNGEIVDLERDGHKINYQEVRDDNDRKLITVDLPNVGTKALTGYMLDKDGDPEIAFGFNSGYRELHYLQEGGWHQSPINLEKVRVVGPGNNRGELLMHTIGQDGKPGPLGLVDLASGELRTRLYQDEYYNFMGWAYRDYTTHEIVGLRMERAYPSVLWFTESRKQVQKMLNAAFPRQFVEILGGSKDESRYVFKVSSDRNPGVFNWIDLNTRQISLIKNSMPWLDFERLLPMSPFRFKTRDGHTLDGYLTLPKGASKEKRAPLVVLPHGGPWGVRDGWGFNSEVQFLASRGYAVLQPNYRGSLGTEWMFPEGAYYEVKKMQYDVIDATKAAIAGGMVDSERVAIMGWSFGGYHAVACSAEEPSLFRCAIGLAGVYDYGHRLERLKQEDKENLTNYYEYMTRFLGEPAKFPEKYDEISPIKHVSKIRIPVLLAHGRQDHIVNPEETRKLAAKLKDCGVPCEYTIVPEEGHGFQNIDNTVELYTRIEAFLAKHLAPRSAR